MFDYEQFLTSQTLLYKLQGWPIEDAKRQAFADLWINRFELRQQEKKVLK